MGRSVRCASSLLVSLLVFSLPGARLCAEEIPAATGPADMELRKSFRFVRRATRQGPQQPSGGERGTPHAATDAGGVPRLGSVAEALDEELQDTGTLHFPGSDGRGVVLQASTTPILATATGRRLIIDRERTIDGAVAEEISRRWPGFSVVQPPAGANLRDLLGSVLGAAGYDTVLRSVPLVFGRGVTVSVTPDFVVLRTERDLLAGETRAISIVDSAAAIPPEVRELALEHRVRIVELSSEGAPAGPSRAPWRDATGRVTTMESARLAPIVEEIAIALGCSVERRGQFSAAPDERPAGADLRISRDGKTALVVENPDPHPEERLGRQGEPAIALSAGSLPEAIGTLLNRLNLPVIGPTVEFYRASAPGSARRFVISVPGLLAASGGRRLLITGERPPPLVRLYLTREGIDIFEYRVAGR